MRTIRMKIYWAIAIFQLYITLAFAQTPFHAKSFIPAVNAKVEELEEGSEEASEAKVSQQYIEDIYYPQKGLTALQKVEIEDALKHVPNDPAEKLRALGWQFIGPDFITNNGYIANQDPKDRKWSGRVTCVEYTNVLRVSSASGGIYEGMLVGPLPVWVSIGDSLPIGTIGSFASNPQNPETIVVGTGEFSFSGSPIAPSTPYGTRGLWITHNGGATWTKANCTPNVDNISFEKIVFAPGDSTLVYAAGLNGVYYSLDGGNYWQQIPPPTTSAIATDVAAASDGIHILMGYVRSSSVGTGTPSSTYYSSTILASPQSLTNDFVVQGKQPADVKFAYAASNPAIAYASCFYFAAPGNPPNDTTGVIFRSSQYGAPGTWTRCNIFDIAQQGLLGYHWGGQGWRDNIIGVSTIDPNKVVAGGGPTFYSVDGLNFYQNDAEHADQCAISWKPDGSQALLGNDGGFFFSNDDGQTWDGAANYLPITQPYFLDVDPQNSQKIVCGTQDNGILIYNTTMNKWEYANGGDGGDCVFHPTNNSILYGTYGGADFTRCKSTGSGVETTWQNIDANIVHLNQGQFNSPIATDFVAQNYLYSSHGTIAYVSTDGATWTALNSGNLFPASCREIAVGSSANPHVYYALNPNFSGAIPRLDVDGSPNVMTSVNSPTFVGYPRSFWAELPNSQQVYCVIGGVVISNTKVYKSWNAGSTWVNITGDLPSSFPPLTDIWVNPSDTLNIVIATERGCFKTDNGGTNWYKWSFGLPNGLLVTDIDYAYENGSVYAFISTFGRGIWKRLVSDADPFQVGLNEGVINRAARLTCSPNPLGNDKMQVAVYLPVKADIELTIFNLQGQVIAVKSEFGLMANENYVYEFELGDLSAGIYFCELKYNGKRITTKIIKQ